MIEACNTHCSHEAMPAQPPQRFITLDLPQAGHTMPPQSARMPAECPQNARERRSSKGSCGLQVLWAKRAASLLNGWCAVDPRVKIEGGPFP